MFNETWENKDRPIKIRDWKAKEILTAGLLFCESVKTTINFVEKIQDFENDDLEYVVLRLKAI